MMNKKIDTVLRKLIKSKLIDSSMKENIGSINSENEFSELLVENCGWCFEVSTEDWGSLQPANQEYVDLLRLIQEKSDGGVTFVIESSRIHDEKVELSFSFLGFLYEWEFDNSCNQFDEDFLEELIMLQERHDLEVNCIELNGCDVLTLAIVPTDISKILIKNKLAVGTYGSNEKSRKLVNERIYEAKLNKSKQLLLSELKIDSLPSDISSLKQLEIIDLSFNNFTEIPPALRKLKNLRQLNLNGNKLSAVPDWISELVTIERLHLGANRIKGLPESLSNLDSLRILSLHMNNLTEFPMAVLNINNLERLDLYKNKVAYLPEKVGLMKNLVHLSLWGNKLKSLPDEIGNIAELRSLELNDNKLTKLPYSIGALSNLSELYVDFNLLEELPDSIENMNSLWRLCASFNNLKDLPRSIGKTESLFRVEIDGNPLDPELSSIYKKSSRKDFISYLKERAGIRSD